MNRPLLRRLIKLLPDLIPLLLELFDIDINGIPPGAMGAKPADQKALILRKLREEIDGLTDEDIAELCNDE